MSEYAYLDHNASAPPRPEVIDAMAEVMRESANASSIHRPGRAARAHVERARRSLAALIGAEPGQVVFTGGGTEANNQALRCAGRVRAILSAVEHESVHNARPDGETAPVDASGVIDLAALERMLAARREPSVVAVMLANNETGVLQPIAEISALAQRFGAVLHCDAVQAAGKIPLDAAAFGADSYALSAHKIAGPQGVGALVLRSPGAFGRLLHGGGQERGFRAGTENVAGIVGFGVAAELAAAALPDFARLAEQRDALEARIRAIAPNAAVFGATAQRLPNTTKFSMPGVSADIQVMALDLAGVAVSAGAACSAGKVDPPYVLTAMGVPDAEANTAIRVSLGWRTRPGDIDRLIAAWREIYLRATQRAA